MESANLTSRAAWLVRAASALGLVLSSLSASALVVTDVMGIKSKDGGNTFYLKAGTPTTVLNTTATLASRFVENGVVSRADNLPRGAIVLEFAANEAGMVNDWQKFKAYANGNVAYLNDGDREGSRIYVRGDVSYYGAAAWTLATPAGQSYTVSAWSEQNWHDAPPVCYHFPVWNGMMGGECTLPDGQTGYYLQNDPRVQPYPNPPSGTPAPVSFTLREYVPMTAVATLSETQGLNVNLTLANEDEGQTGAVFAALMIDGKFFFIHEDRTTITWYQGESTLPPVFTGALHSGSLNLWPSMSAADRQALKDMGAVLLVGYGTGANADAATLEMLKVDTRLPTSTKQIDKMRYQMALPASGW